MAEGLASPLPTRSRSAVIFAVGTSQTLAWASSHYLPAILADPISAGIDVPRSWVFAALSTSLLIAALAGPFVGRLIDRRGGRAVLTLSTLVLGAGLIALASAVGPISLFAAWALLGIGMALGLYDAAFSALTSIYGAEARGPITGITLFAGFASTVGWPLSSLLNDLVGWRQTCLVWAALNLLVSLPLYRFLLPASERREQPRHLPQTRVSWKPYKEMFLLAYAFAAAGFVTGAMAAHLPKLLELGGATPVQAVAAAALLGPSQVAARLVEFFILRRAHPLVSARIAVSLHPVGAAALPFLGVPGAAVFSVLYGAGNGLLTIARGAVPLAVFGPYRYGERTGLLGAPARAVQAFSPLVFGLLLDYMGESVIFVSAGCCLSALGALLFLRPTRERGEGAG